MFMKKIVKRIVAGAACVAVLMAAVPVCAAVTHNAGTIGIVSASFDMDS